MRTEDMVQVQQSHLSEGPQHVFNQESSMTPRSSRSRSRSSRSSSSSSSDSSYSSSSDRSSRSPSVSRRARRRHCHGSRYSSSSSSRSRSHPRCCRASGWSRCCHRRRRSRSYSPYPRRSYRYGGRRYSRSISRSSSRERYYKRSRRSRSRSASYRSARGAYVGRYRCRFTPSPIRRSYRRKSKSPERSVWLTQKDKMHLLNIARQNAARFLGVDVVKLPASVRGVEGQDKKMLKSETEKRMSANPLKNPSQDEAGADVEMSTSPRKPISFSNAVAKPSNNPTSCVTESKVTSRADRVGNRMPYGQWIPVKAIST